MLDIAIRTWVRVTSRATEIREERGATAVEYALMIALIALVIVSAVAFMGESTNSQFERPELIAGLS